MYSYIIYLIEFKTRLQHTKIRLSSIWCILYTKQELAVGNPSLPTHPNFSWTSCLYPISIFFFSSLFHTSSKCRLPAADHRCMYIHTRHITKVSSPIYSRSLSTQLPSYQVCILSHILSFHHPQYNREFEDMRKRKFVHEY